MIFLAISSTSYGHLSLDGSILSAFPTACNRKRQRYPCGIWKNFVKLSAVYGQIVEKGIEAEIIDIFRLTVQMRNSRSESEDREYDRLISPVLNDKGEFFDTATADKTLPQDADANGAYCIALKGLYEVKQIKENWKENEQFPRNKLVQDNKTWFDFMQKKRYL